MTPDDLATLLDEADHHPWESVRAARLTAAGETHPRVSWLVAHLTDTKRDSWTLIKDAAAVPGPPPGADPTGLMVWEVEAARALPAPALHLRLTHAQASFTVAELLRLNPRHTARHAGQPAALAAGLRPPA